MNHHIENIRKERNFIIDHVKELSLEKLNRIPHGFNNNIFWNLGHLVASQQALLYFRAGLQAPLAKELYADYMSGTKPERFYEGDEEDRIKELLLSSLDQLQRDYQSKVFSSFVPYTNRYGSVLNNVDDAIAYMQFHEGLHSGVIMSIKKLVQK